jgi:hypothetical protein
MNRTAWAFALGCCLPLCALLAACVELPPTPNMTGARSLVSGAEPRAAAVAFTLDDNRVFLPVTLIRPDGGEIHTLAFLNHGSPAPVLSNAIYRQLQIGKGEPLRMRVGGMSLEAPSEVVQSESIANTARLFIGPHKRLATAQQKAAASAYLAQFPGGQIAALAAPLDVGMVFPAGLMQRYRVTLDYGAKILTLEPPGGPTPEGAAVPMTVNPATGYATVKMMFAGRTHAMAIDSGGSYSAVRMAEADALSSAHPDWLRSAGPVGEAQLTLGPSDVGTRVIQAPGAKIGALELPTFRAVGAGYRGAMGLVANGLFWDFYSGRQGQRSDGWIGGNVLKSFRVTMDYPAGMSWWLREAPLDEHDLDQVGLTLARSKAVTTVAGVVRKDGWTTAPGVRRGDRIVAVDGQPLDKATRGQVLAALHGKPGERRRLTLERKGQTLEVEAPVTAF